MITDDWNEVNRLVHEQLKVLPGIAVAISCKTGVSESTVNRLKAHGIPVAPSNLVEIADALGYNLKFSLVKRRLPK